MAFLPGEQGEHFKVNLYDHGAGVAVADVDGDGSDDVYLCNQLGANALFLNDGQGRFRDVTDRAGVGLPDRISTAATFADVDGDGHLDLYVATTRGGNVLFRNRGDGTFEDVTAAAGLTLVAHSQQGYFFDADGDGDLDLLVLNTAAWTTADVEPSGRYYVGPATIEEMMKAPPERNRFYLNDGRGVFADATDASGLAGHGWSSDAAIFDADGDGHLDVYVARMFGGATFHRNDGRGRFPGETLKETRARFVRSAAGGVGTKVFDYDGDGRLDVLTVDMHSDMWMTPDFDPTSMPERKRGLTYTPNAKGPGIANPASEGIFTLPGEALVFGNTLHRNLGGGQFAEVSLRAGVETLWPWGVATGDFDADGHEDVYIPSGMGHPFAYWRSPLLHNRGNGTFVDVAAQAGLDPPPGGRHLAESIGGRPAAHSSRAAATADFDGDGRLDLVVNTFNAPALLYMNRSEPRPWIAFRLVGPPGNRDAIGATVTVRAGTRALVRPVGTAGGYLAQSSSLLHFGLGDLPEVGLVEVRWPSGKVTRIERPAAGRVHRLVAPP